MDIKEAVAARRSIRGFKPDPVPRKVLEEIVRISTRAPSALNTQPWGIVIVTGEPLAKIRSANAEALGSGKMPQSDLPIEGKPFEGVYRERQRELGFELYGLLGIARDDRQKRAEWAMKGFRMFDAPAAIFLTADASLEPALTYSDIGGLAQTICLVALDYGLGTCINNQGIVYPDVIRQVTGLADSMKMYLCVAIGYPDWAHPANKLESSRAPLEKNTYWYGY